MLRIARAMIGCLVRNAARIGPAERTGRIVLGPHDLLHGVVDWLPRIAQPCFESAESLVPPAIELLRIIAVRNAEPSRDQ